MALHILDVLENIPMHLKSIEMVLQKLENMGYLKNMNTFLFLTMFLKSIVTVLENLISWKILALLHKS
jgi:hypothetical protein